MHIRRRGVVAVTAGVLLCLPATALAQEAEPSEAVGIGAASTAQQQAPTPPPAPEPPPSDQTGIGEAAVVECRGTVTATVVDVAGAPVGGGLLSVAGQQFTGSGTVESPCGAVSASLLDAPDGYAPVGTTLRDVPVRQGDDTAVTFTVDTVAVLGTQYQQSEQAPPAPAPAPVAEQVDRPAAAHPAPATPPAADVAQAPAGTTELAMTGREDAPVLSTAALLCVLVGVLLLRLAPAPARA